MAEELEGVTAQVVTAIICEGDAIGAVAILSGSPGRGLREMGDEAGIDSGRIFGEADGRIICRKEKKKR